TDRGDRWRRLHLRSDDSHRALPPSSERAVSLRRRADAGLLSLRAAVAAPEERGARGARRRADRGGRESAQRLARMIGEMTPAGSLAPPASLTVQGVPTMPCGVPSASKAKPEIV